MAHWASYVQMTWDQKMVCDCLHSHLLLMDWSNCYDEASTSVQPPLDVPISGFQG